MNGMLVVMRLLHILTGVFWAGTLIFVALFLQPSVAEAGPEGGKVMMAMARRRFMDIMPVVALITVVSGVWLLWHVSGGFSSAWMGSPLGITLSIGGTAAIIGLIVGVTVLRPSMMKAMALAQGAAQLSGAEKDAQLAAAAALRGRAAVAGRIIASLLAVAVIAMAVARYV